MISPWLNSEHDSSVKSIKFPKLRKNEIFERFREIFQRKSKPFGLGSDVCCFYPISFNTSILLSVLKNRTSKNGTPETLDHPLKLKYFEIFEKFFGENGINFLMDILSIWRILEDFGYHNVAWKKGSILQKLVSLNGVMMTGLDRVTKWIYEVIIDKMEFVKMSP